MRRFIKDRKIISVTALFLFLTVCIFIFSCTRSGFDKSGIKLKITDEIGRVVEVNPEISRIVSMAPSITEILYALDLGDSIVGVTDFCDYPEDAKKKEKIGGFVNPDIEKIVQLRPDIVFATYDGTKREDVERLSYLGIAVYVIQSKCVDDILVSISDIGKVTGRIVKAEGLIEQMRQRVDSITNFIGKRKNSPKVLVVFSADPLISASKGTFADDLIRMAGGLNIVGDQKVKYPRIDMELVLSRLPEAIVMSSMNSEEPDDNLKSFWNEWNDIPAVKNRRVFVIETDLMTLPGPRIVEGYEKFARIIHPELFQ